MLLCRGREGLNENRFRKKKGDPLVLKLNHLVEHFSNLSFRVKGVYQYKIEPGAVGMQNSAPYPGFIFPMSGQAQFSFDGTPYLAQVGKVIHGGANMSLGKRVVGNARWEYISVLYEISAPEPKGICLTDTHFELDMGYSPRMEGLLCRLWKASNQPGVLPVFQTEALFRCVLEEVFVNTRNRANDGTHTLFEQAASYIQEHYMDSLSVKGLAEQNGVNENRLFYVFQKLAGMGPGEYLMAYRLNRAKELLVTGVVPVSQVAKSVGYADAFYFSRIFKKHFGVSPSQWRETFRNNP